MRSLARNCMHINEVAYGHSSSHKQLCARTQIGRDVRLLTVSWCMENATLEGSSTAPAMTWCSKL